MGYRGIAGHRNAAPAFKKTAAATASAATSVSEWSKAFIYAGAWLNFFVKPP